jgi:hypothetical protein
MVQFLLKDKITITTYKFLPNSDELRSGVQKRSCYEVNGFTK